MISAPGSSRGALGMRYCVNGSHSPWRCPHISATGCSCASLAHVRPWDTDGRGRRMKVIMCFVSQTTRRLVSSSWLSWWNCSVSAIVLKGCTQSRRRDVVAIVRPLQHRTRRRACGCTIARMRSNTVYLLARYASRLRLCTPFSLHFGRNFWNAARPSSWLP